MTASDELDHAWDAFLAAVTDATRTMRETAPAGDPLCRAEGYAFIQAILATAWVSIGYPDRDFPVVPEAYSQVFNVGSPTGEYLYQTLHLDPAGDYRIWGNRGSVSHIDLQQAANWFGEAGDGLRSESLSNESFDELGITLAADGSFELFFTVAPRGGNWWPRNPRTRSLFIKQIILNWGVDVPATFNVERLDAPTAAPARRSLAESARRLNQQAAYIRDFARVHGKFLAGIVASVGYNGFREDRFDASAGHLDQRYWHLAIDIQPGEALLLEWDVGQADHCLYWSAILNDSRWAALDYRCRQTSLSNTQARVDGDGVFRALVCAEDPGVDNWLDTLEGQGKILMLRAKRCPGMPEPRVARLPLAEAVRALGDEAVPVAGEARRASYRQRRMAYDHRYGRGLPAGASSTTSNG